MKRISNQITAAALKLLVCGGLLAASSALAATYTWTNSTGMSLNTSTSWSPNGVPSSSGGDTMLWNGTAAGNLDVALTNNLSSGNGLLMSVTAGQTGNLTITNSAATLALRFNQGNSLLVANGAGAVTFGTGGGNPATPFQLVMGVGNGAVHLWTNNSANPVTIQTNCYFGLGGGGSHTLTLGGSGDFILNNSIKSANSSSLSLNVNGSGTVSLAGVQAPGATLSGGHSNTRLFGGTLRLMGADALNSSTLTLSGGNLDSGVANMVVSGVNPQTWSGDFTFVGTESLNLGSGAVTMSGSRIVTVSAKTLEVDGVISGAGSLTKSGAGTLVLGGANLYSGGTVVSNGVLKLGNSSALGASTGDLTVHGTVNLNGNSISIGSLSGNATGVIDDIAGSGSDTVAVNSASNSVFAGVIKNTTGSVALTKDGSGALTLSGANTYSGNTTVTAGSLLVNGSIGSGAVTVASGATFGGSGSIGGSVDWQSGSAGSFSLTPTTGAGSNSTPLTVSGSVTLNDNAITVNVLGGTPIGVGTYKLMSYNNAGSSGAFSTGSPTYTGAGAMSGTASTVTTSGGQVILTVIFTGLSATWTNNGDGNWTTGANWNSNPSYPKDPGDAAFLGVGSAYTTVTLNSPISLSALTFTNANSFLVADAGNALTMNNPSGSALITVNAGASNTIAPAVSLATNLSISTVSGASVALTNVISNATGTQTLTASGSGTVVLSGNNTYGPGAGSVGTILGGGVLQLDNANAIGAGDLSLSGSGTIRAGAAVTLANNIAVNSSTVTVDNNGNNVALSGVISGAGNVTKSGIGTLALNNANTYSGTTTVNAGILKLGIAGALNSGDVTVNTNGTLDLNGLSATVNGLRGYGTVDSLSGGAVTLTVGESNSVLATFQGNLKNTSGSLSLVKNGTGTQVLSGTNSYSGGTTINAGALQVGNGVAGSSGSVGTGAVLNNSTLAFNLNGSNAFANVISGSGSLYLNNSGMTLNLTGNNSFSGDVTVNSGSLWVTTSSALGVGPKSVTCNTPNSSAHLDGSAGALNLDSSITFTLSGPALFNEAGSNTISGPINMTFGVGNVVVQANGGLLNLAGSVNALVSRTIILGGAANGLVSGQIQNSGGTCSVQKQDAGTWILSGENLYSGATAVSGGTLLVNGNNYGAGAVTVASGATLGGTGSLSSTTTWQSGSQGAFTITPSGGANTTPFTIYGNVTLNANNLTVHVAGGTPLSPGSYDLLTEGNGFSSISGSFASTPTITGAGIASGNIAVVTTSSSAATLTVAALPAPVQLTNAMTGPNTLSLSWPSGQGWRLQMQTNSLSTGLGTNWAYVTDSSVSSTNITINPALPTVFYRLANP